MKKEGQTAKILITIFYLLIDHEELTDEKYELQYVRFKLLFQHARSLCTPIVLNCILRELKKFQESNGEEKSETNEEDGVDVNKETKP